MCDNRGGTFGPWRRKQEVSELTLSVCRTWPQQYFSRTAFFLLSSKTPFLGWPDDRQKRLGFVVCKCLCVGVLWKEGCGRQTRSSFHTHLYWIACLATSWGDAPFFSPADLQHHQGTFKGVKHFPGLWNSFRPTAFHSSGSRALKIQSMATLSDTLMSVEYVWLKPAFNDHQQGIYLGAGVLHLWNSVSAFKRNLQQST